MKTRIENPSEEEKYLFCQAFACHLWRRTLEYPPEPSLASSSLKPSCSSKSKHRHTIIYIYSQMYMKKKSNKIKQKIKNLADDDIVGVIGVFHRGFLGRRVVVGVAVWGVALLPLSPLRHRFVFSSLFSGCECKQLQNPFLIFFGFYLIFFFNFSAK